MKLLARTIPCTLAFLGVLVVAPAVTPGSAEAQLRTGERIRVRRGPQLPPAYRRAPSAPFERSGEREWLGGRFFGFLGDSLLLRVNDEVTVRVALRPVPPDVERRLRISHRAGRGAVIGGGIGLVVGAILAGIPGEDRVGSDDRPLDDDEIGKLVAATAVGAGLGALIGLAVGEYEWQGVRVSAASTPGSRGLSLQVRLRPPPGG